MLDTLSALLAGVPGGLTRDNLTKLLRPAIDRLSTQAVVNAAPVIFGATSVNAKTAASTTYFSVQGKIVSVAASTPLTTPSLAAFPANSYSICCWFVDKTGTITALVGAPGTSLSTAQFPNFPEGKALIGFAIATLAGGMQWGTTALDAATTLYFGPVGAFDPSYNL